MDAIPTQTGTTLLSSSDLKTDRPRSLQWYVVGWILAAEVVSGLAIFVEAFINSGMGHKGAIPSYISFPTSLLVTQMVLLLAAIHRGRIMAGGRCLSIALGNVPCKRRWPIFATGFVVLLWAGMFVWGQIVHPTPISFVPGNNINSALATGGWWSTSIIVFASVVLAPVGEELFFRGWLWEGLRQSWRPVPVMLGTAMPWLFIHALDRGAATLVLIPTAVCFSLARQFCGSVRASIALHVLNNLVAVSASVWFLKELNT